MTHRATEQDVVPPEVLELGNAIEQSFEGTMGAALSKALCTGWATIATAVGVAHSGEPFSVDFEMEGHRTVVVSFKVKAN